MARVETVLGNAAGAAAIALGMAMNEPAATEQPAVGNGIDLIGVEEARICKDARSSSETTLSAFRTTCIPSETVGDKLCDALAESTEMNIGAFQNACNGKSHDI